MGHLARLVGANYHEYLRNQTLCFVLFEDTDLHGELLPRFFQVSARIAKEKQDRTFAIIDCKKNKCPDNYLEVLARYSQGAWQEGYEGDFSERGLQSWLSQ